MTPAHAYMLLGVVLLLSSMMSGAWSLRWRRRENGRPLAMMHALIASVGAFTALRMVSLATTRAGFSWLRVTDPEVLLLAAYLLLQAIARVIELWREYDRELYAAKLRRRLVGEALEAISD